MSTKASLFLASMTFAASLGQAEIQGEVIAAYNASVGRVGVMPANSNLPFQYISCATTVRLRLEQSQLVR